MKGMVYYGINNIYSVKIGSALIQCRIKGKVLKTDSNYNPIAPGDFVEVDEISGNQGLITERLPRKNEFSRLNKKKELPQTIAANIDYVICFTTPNTPPFRPRFIDRVLIQAENSGIPCAIVLNKIDLKASDDVIERTEYFKNLGYPLFKISNFKKIGIIEFKHFLKNKISVFIGQSGVGKTSAINAMFPGINLKTGDISEKYDRGIHTTNFGEVITSEDIFIIDTPGIRELELFGIKSSEIKNYFPEFVKHADKCEYSSCIHLNEENCGIKKALNKGNIIEDRYLSYCNIMAELIEKEKNFYS